MHVISSAATHTILKKRKIPSLQLHYTDAKKALATTQIGSTIIKELTGRSANPKTNYSATRKFGEKRKEMGVSLSCEF